MRITAILLLALTPLCALARGQDGPTEIIQDGPHFTVICWFVGEHLEKEGTRELVDKQTGEEFTVKPRHSFFWIPVKWCGALIMLVAAAIVLLEIAAG